MDDNGSVGIKQVRISDIRVIPDLYPRVKEDPAAIARYRDGIDNLPAVTIARDGILVDGYHRLQAHKLEGRDTIRAEDLGNLSDAEIFNEAVERNATHGQQLSRDDKAHVARKLWRTLAHLENGGRKSLIAQRLSISERAVERFTKEERDAEEKEQKDKALSLWLDCHTQEEIAAAVGVTDGTVSNWINSNFRQLSQFGVRPGANPDRKDDWGNVQHFDVWSFSMPKEDNTGYFGAMPPQVVENLLWLYTDIGDIVFDPFAGSGTTIKVAREMGRRVWASDRIPYTDLLPIHQHDIAKDGWPSIAPKRDVKFVLLDPPYWIQAKERYSKDPEDMGNMPYEQFMAAWNSVVQTCTTALTNGGYLAFIVSPAEVKDEDVVVDLAHEMYKTCEKAGLKTVRRIIVTYGTQQANGHQVTWARENHKLLKLYRDLVVFKKVVA